MTSPRIRLSLRWLLVTVGVVGLALATFARLQARSRAFDALGSCYEARFAAEAKIKFDRRLRLLELSGKYRMASHRPWLPVESDLSEPK